MRISGAAWAAAGPGKDHALAKASNKGNKDARLDEQDDKDDERARRGKQVRIFFGVLADPRLIDAGIGERRQHGSGNRAANVAG
jgi:hypothetical protein